MTERDSFDVFIIGGGINGCGIARDAVGRGYSVGLCEKGDLASGTSSWSTKLIHGGLRYLEHYEFRLVRESLKEREVLWRMAPHIIWPLRFVLPHHKGLRPAWLLRLGLFIYDHLGGREKLPSTKVLDLRADEAGKPLRDGYAKGFEYSDCWVQDTRLTILNARDAADRGADIMTGVECVGLDRTDTAWRVTLRDVETRIERVVTARYVVNAAGPWVDKVLQGVARSNAARNVRLVQGSHIVVPKLYDHDRCYIFQNPDGRIFFAIPYEREFTLIGTTDRDFDGDLDDFGITEAETDYLLAGASSYFDRELGRDDVVWTYSGVRPLFDNGTEAAQAATRDYVLRPDGTPVLLNIFGGKITTYRKLAEAALEKIEATLGAKGAPWTAGTTLPGGDFPEDAAADLITRLSKNHPTAAPDMIARLVRHYGTRADEILSTPRGQCFGSDLYEAEVRYLMNNEWARSADDVLWRRTKLGLRLTKAEAAALRDWMAERREAA